MNTWLVHQTSSNFIFCRNCTNSLCKRNLNCVQSTSRKNILLPLSCLLYEPPVCRAPLISWCFPLFAKSTCVQRGQESTTKSQTIHWIFWACRNYTSWLYTRDMWIPHNPIILFVWIENKTSSIVLNFSIIQQLNFFHHTGQCTKLHVPSHLALSRDKTPPTTSKSIWGVVQF